jgi:hypothetical protein
MAWRGNENIESENHVAAQWRNGAGVAINVAQCQRLAINGSQYGAKAYLSMAKKY